MTTDLEMAFKAITDKAASYETLWKYYDGSAPLKFSTARLARAFGKVSYFAENWSSVIIRAVLDRLVLKGFDIKQEGPNAQIDALFARYNLNLDAQDVHEALQVTGEAFLIVDVVDGETDIYFNDPAMCEMFYDPDRPKLKLFAAKKWSTSDGVFINLYYPDRTEKWASGKGQTAKSFELVESVPNFDGVIPVFHFRNSRRIIKGELDQSSISMLDAINKLFSDMMVAAEFESFKTRVIISQIDPGDIKIGPDMTLWLAANEESGGQSTEIKELTGSDFENFLKPISEIATALAVTTSTPRHYLTNVGANISGEALLVEESALVKKVIKRQEAYSPTWIEAIVYILKLNGITVDANSIVPVWGPVETTQPLLMAQVYKTEREAGISLEASLRRHGADDAEIKQILGDNSQVDTPPTDTNTLPSAGE